MRDNICTSDGGKALSISDNVSHISINGMILSDRCKVKDSDSEVIFGINVLPDSEVKSFFVEVEIHFPI